MAFFYRVYATTAAGGVPTEVKFHDSRNADAWCASNGAHFYFVQESD